MRNSAAIEVALLAVSTTLGYWIWRQHGSLHVIIWYVFLWRVSRLPLQLEPLHPDRAGGIGFVGDCMRALAN